MISRRVAALLVGVALAIGLVLGASGTIAARAPGATATLDCNDHMAGATGMTGGSSAMMGGSGRAMMGSGVGMMGGSFETMGSDTSSMFEWMRQHHGGATPQATP